ncbi:MAG: permease [Hyphomicrobiales bacterium]|nr:permease [Hyphomicrobiales bacterium]
MNKPASLPWFARHEFGLFWRDWISMMTAGRRQREIRLAGILAVALIFMHVLAFFVLVATVANGIALTIPVLVFLGGTMLLSFSLMLSQAMESVTRAFYARDDLDLILSSPAMVQRLFAVRITAISGITMSMSLLLAFPFINVMIYLDGPKWLAAFAVLGAMAAIATALAVAITILLFTTIGPARTRFISQLVAAIVGASFVIGIQIAAIVYFGNISRLDVLTSDILYSIVPGEDSWWWFPVRALAGEPASLILLLAAGVGTLALTIRLTADNFGDFIVAANGVSHNRDRSKATQPRFRSLNAAQALRMKEWILLKRDPWLVSQTLMQLLYLLPPAILLWRNFSGAASSLVILVPVIVMAAGQLAGGLAWLAISGEDAPDLVSTAPLTPHATIRAKIEAVMITIAAIFLPFIMALAFADGWIALVTITGVAISSICSIVIQLWFRKQARRSHFRRRQTSSRAATFAEAFSSILWAGTTGVAAVGSWLAIGLAIPAIIVMLIARAIAPSRQ